MLGVMTRPEVNLQDILKLLYVGTGLNKAAKDHKQT